MSGKLLVRWRPLALFLLVLLALALRLYGLNWDQGNNFHPDERQILFHVTAIAWPTSFEQFRDPVHSPLNPHFFAYGSFPIYLLALLGNILSHFFPSIGSFTNLTLLGRVLSALFDSGTVLLTGLLALLLIKDPTPGRRRAWSVALLAAALVAFTPFQLQLSHFYAVDTILLFFAVLTVYACCKLVESERLMLWSALAGLSYGLALATKFSAAPLAVPFLLAVTYRWWQRRDGLGALITLFYTGFITIAVFFITQPYALLDFANYVQQVAEQGSLARGALDLPYVRQFAGTVPYLYEMQNMLLWGLGLMLGLASLVGIVWLLWRTWKGKGDLWPIVLAWIFAYFLVTGSFYVKFMRYMLPLYPFLALIAAALVLAFFGYLQGSDLRVGARLGRFASFLPIVVLCLVLGGTIFQGLALLNVYSQPNTRVQASRWMYEHLPAGSVLTYEQWDDPLPVAVDGHNPETYVQASYTDAGGQASTGLDLYGDDTPEKARQLAQLLPTIDAITMATDRLDKSIPRLPERYPLTIHYYQLLYSGQLGFHLAAQFENRPNLFGIVLNDSDADESYSVFDHPTSRIFVRDTPYPYTSDQLLQKLLDGVQLPPTGANLSGTQRSLLLTSQQISDNQNSPPLSTQFPSDGFTNSLPVLFWWLVVFMLGSLAYPLLFPVLRGLPDRGYVFSKTCGVLIVAYVGWLCSSLHLFSFSNLSTWLLTGLFALGAAFAFYRQRAPIVSFLRQHWRLIVFCECLFTLAFLFFVTIRSFDPDLWSPLRGGEKPMELAFLHAVLRSPYMPPLDPWFSGGYINYYYFGYVIVATYIRLTAIVPTTAFNLAIPTLFAMAFSGATIIVYSLARSVPISLLGGFFAMLIGNLDGLGQLGQQLLALLAHVGPPPYDYWQSSRVIPFTINEFPYWTFLFADLHPHVIDMPIVVFMLGIVASVLLSASRQATQDGGRFGLPLLYLLAAFVFGTIACVNTWDMPLCALLLSGALLVQGFWEKRGEEGRIIALALIKRLALALVLCGLGYALYYPFYAKYQQLYVNGVGLVTQGSDRHDYLVYFGFWLFIAFSFLLLEAYRRWIAPLRRTGSAWLSWVALVVGCLVAFVCLLGGLKLLLLALLVLAVALFISLLRGIARRSAQLVQELKGAVDGGHEIAKRLYTYLLLTVALGIALGIELIYIRDFLDGGDYERMNTVFKFSIQAWLCFALGGALAVQRIWHILRGAKKQIWTVVLASLVVACSIFLIEGTLSRIQDHQLWIDAQKPVLSASYTPTLDGFAFVRSWYPGDAAAITWLNSHVSGSPVILEAAPPVSYQWYSRVSVFTGLPDVLGWSDHEAEQRYDSQQLNRVTDVGLIYTTEDSQEALTLLRFYHVRYVYVGELERQLYGAQSATGIDKFETMVDAGLRVVYRANGVTIYEVV